MGPQAACGAPFIDPAGDEVLIDQLVGENVLRELTELGHRLASQESTIWPRLSANPGAIKRDGKNLLGGVDLFTTGVAAGY